MVTPIPIPADINQTPNIGNNGDAGDSEPVCCRARCFGRLVSLLKRDAVYCAVYLAAGLSVGLPVGLSVGLSVGSSGSGIVTSGVLGAAAGIVTGIAISSVAECLYVKCRRVTPTDSPVELTRIADHNPETIYETTPYHLIRAD